MKNVSGSRFHGNDKKGFQISGPACRCMLFLIFLSASTFQGFSTGWEMKYKFKKGQILKYQYDTENVDSRLRKNDHFIFEFRVDSLSTTGAFITMISKLHTFVKIDYTNADIDKKISFHISESGLLSEFRGVHELFNTIISGIQEPKSIGNKPFISYHWLQLRYWDDYYKMLIGYFFPPLPRTRYDRITESLFNYSRESIRVNQSWGGSYPDSATTELPFQKQILLFLDEKIK